MNTEFKIWLKRQRYSSYNGIITDCSWIEMISIKQYLSHSYRWKIKT